MILTKRISKVFKLCIFVCVCGSVLIGIVLLNKAQNLQSFTHGKYNNTFINYQRNLQVQVNPHHILPAFVRVKQDSNLSKYLLNNTDLKSSSVRIRSRNASAKETVTMPLKPQVPKEMLQQWNTTKQPSYSLHAFYYPWYGAPDYDGNYLHWNHPYIPHWNKKEAQKWPNYTHKPPDDVGSNFYPLLGAYSSRDREIIDAHMQMMRYARIGVVAVSWYPPGDADQQGTGSDFMLPIILDVANKYSLKVAIHVEPYKGRNSVTMRENLKYIFEKYSGHPAFYRTSNMNKKNVPLIYIYDSYLLDSKEWAAIFSDGGKGSVRNTDLDGLFIGLLVETGHKQHVIDSGFDGFYTYFATNKFTYGSTWRVWPELAQFAHTKGLLFIPSVGPGYVDTEVRPWNGANTRKRLDGKYYNEAFAHALNISPKYVSITSFNEWHEGTQIEPAVSKKIKSRRYEDYGSKGPNFYLDLTKAWVNKMIQKVQIIQD